MFQIYTYQHEYHDEYVTVIDNILPTIFCEEL